MATPPWRRSGKPSGTAVSSVSAVWVQADLIEQLRLEPGMTALEVGSGGYSAARGSGAPARTRRSRATPVGS
ncbi:hypothetical protein OIE71_32890 [Streptomyces sp. NBC_01725]